MKKNYKKCDYVYYALEKAYKENKKATPREKYNRYLEIIEVCPRKYLIQSINYMKQVNSSDNGIGDYLALFSILIAGLSMMIATIMSGFCVFAAFKDESDSKEEFVRMLITQFNQFYEYSISTIFFMLLCIAIVSFIFILLKKLYIDSYRSRRVYFVSIIEDYLNVN